MSTNKLPNTTSKKYEIISFIAYGLTIVVASILLFVEPNGFDAKAMIIPLVILLFVSALGIGRAFAVKKKRDAISAIGAVALAIVFTFTGFFIVTAVAWLIGVAHTS